MHAVQVVYVAVLPSSPMDVFSFSEPIGHFHGSFDFLAQLMFFFLFTEDMQSKKKKCTACLKKMTGRIFDYQNQNAPRHNY